MLVSPMAERNKETILEVLADYVDDTSSAFGLELGSGTGQHVVHFAQALPTVIWQPSEISQASQQSISAYIQATKVTNVREPLAIDVAQPWDQWAGLSQGCCDFIIIINLLHMTDQGLEGMFKGIGQLLKPGGICLAYGKGRVLLLIALLGCTSFVHLSPALSSIPHRPCINVMERKNLKPFAVNGIILPECNVQLDNMLQARNPEWGLRDVEELRQLANTNALRLERMLEMPEYSKCLIFRRREL